MLDDAYAKHFFLCYATAALTTTLGADGILLYVRRTLADFDQDTLGQMEADCAAFLATCPDLDTFLTPQEAGLDFWLTRQHGVQEFQTDVPGDRGQRLSQVAVSFPPQDLVENEDGKLHLRGRC